MGGTQGWMTNPFEPAPMLPVPRHRRKPTEEPIPEPEPWYTLQRIIFDRTPETLLGITGFALAIANHYTPEPVIRPTPHTREYLPEVFDIDIDPETHPERWVAGRHYLRGQKRYPTLRNTSTEPR